MNAAKFIRQHFSCCGLLILWSLLASFAAASVNTCPAGSPAAAQLTSPATEMYDSTSRYPTTSDVKDRAFLAPSLTSPADARHLWFDEQTNKLFISTTNNQIHVSSSPFTSSTFLLSESSGINGIATNEDGSRVFFSTSDKRVLSSLSTADDKSVSISGLTASWGALHRSGDIIYSIVHSRNCVRSISASNTVFGSQVGCACHSGTSTTLGAFTSCSLYNPTALSCKTFSSARLCFVTVQQGSVHIVVKLDGRITTASKLFQAASSRDLGAALFIHPNDEDTFFVSAGDSHSPQLFYHESSMATVTDFIGMVGKASDYDHTYLCKANIPHQLAGLAFNSRTGELFLADGTQKISRIRHLFKNVTRTPSMSTESVTRSLRSSLTLTPAHSTSITLSLSLARINTATSSRSQSASNEYTYSSTIPSTLSAPYPSATNTNERITNSPTVSKSMVDTSSLTVVRVLTLTATKRTSDSRSISSSPSTTASATPSASTSATVICRTPSHTRETVAPKTPAPPLEPGERCESLPAGLFTPAKFFTVEENAIMDDRITLRWNLTDDIIDASRWSASNNSPIAIPATAFAIVFRQPPAGEAPASGGFIQYVTSDNILGLQANASLVVNPATLQATLSFGPLPRYAIRAVAERLDLWLTAEWFINGSRFCGNRVRTLHVASITIEPAPDTLLADARVANEVIGDTALVTSFVSGGGGGGGAAGDVTSVAILSTMSCASPEQRQTGANARLLAPIPLGESTESMLLGNLVLVAVVTLLHGGATALLVHRRGLARLPLIAMALTRFPSWSVAIGGVVHQGTVFLSLRLLVGGAASSGGGVALGALGALFSVPMPVVAVALGMRKIDAVFVEYDYAQETDERPQGPPKRWLQMLLPRGRWEPAEMRRAYGVMLSPFAKTNPLWFLFFFTSPSVIAISAAPTPDGEDGCVQQYAVIAALQLVYVGVLAVCRPYRSVFANVTASLSAATVSVVAMASAMAVDDPHSAAPVHLSAGVMMVQGGVTMSRVMYTMLMILRERKITQGVFLRPVMRRCPQRHPFDLEEVQSRPPLNNRYFVPPPLTVADIPPDDDDFLSMLNQPLLVVKVVDAEEHDFMLDAGPGGEEEMGSITDEAAVEEIGNDSLISHPSVVILEEDSTPQTQASTAHKVMVEVTAAEMAGLLGTKVRQGDDLMDILAHVEQRRGTRMVALEQHDLTNQPDDDHADPLGESDDSFMCDSANLDVL